MTSAVMPTDAHARGAQRTWTIAGFTALAGHLIVAAMVLAWARQPQPPLPRPPVPEPPMLIELPPLAVPAAAAPAGLAGQPTPPPQQAAAMPLGIPPVAAPLPRDPVVLPPAAPQAALRQLTPAPASAPAPAAAAPATPPQASPVPAGAGRASTVAADPRAKKQEADYFALVSAHLNRRKTYPVEARQARQQGVVVVRFTVDRSGHVSGVSIKRGSGHAVLDAATLALVQRVAPLPRMPASMQRDSITLSLPIDYSLRTD